MFNNYKKILVSAFAVASLTIMGCKKDYLDTKPTDQMSVDDLFSTTQNAYIILNGMHNYLTAPGAGGQGNAADWGQKAHDLAHDAMGRDMVFTASGYDWFTYYYQYVSTQSSTYWMPYISWTFYYRMINNANTLLARIDAAEGSESEKADIKAQALAYRAWSYFSLANDFCLTYNAPGFATAKGVPLMLEPTNLETEFKGRGLASDVYKQIVSDIEASIANFNLSAEPRSDKSHINIDVAHGIYARIALMMGNYPKADEQADLARVNYQLMTSNELLLGFNNNLNNEWMWASNLAPDQSNQRSLSCLMSWMDVNAPGYAGVGATRAIAKELYDFMGADDVRKSQFSSSYIQNKFHLQDPSGFVYNDLLMRASEMYLIQIESKARANANDPDAIALLEELMQIRQPSYDFAATGRTLLEEALLQRRLELWGEGFQIGDIKRLQIPIVRTPGAGNHSAAIALVMRINNNDPRLLMKIPQRELDNNNQMTAGDQNP